MDPIHAVLEHAERMDLRDVPGAIVATSRRFVLDTLATMIAGTRAPGCGQVLEQLAEWGGAPQATAANGRRLPAPYAALANGSMAHAFDFDETHMVADVHGHASVLPAALAAAEVAGNVSGRELLAAVILGVDVACRLGLSITRDRGWHKTAVCGIFGATLAAGRVLGLRGAALHNAVGIAYSLAAGNFQCLTDAALTKRMQPGFAARAAVESAMFARRGITGAKDVLEGKWGFYRVYYDPGEYDVAPLLDGLGKRFEVEALSMKAYPSCHFGHIAIDAACALAAEMRLRAGDVAAVRVEMPAVSHDYLGGPFRVGESPQVSAQFSTAHNVAAALLYGTLGLAQLQTEAIRNPALLALAERVTTVSNGDQDAYGPVTLHITLHSGRTSTHRTSRLPKGDPTNPMTEAERHAKVRGCLAHAGWPDGGAGELIAWVENLERSERPAAELPRLFGRSTT